ncbi:MAG: hotdog fold thioesterase [Chitinophagaceae bacterium]|nr:hotdog fold thioesterase [Chitinophagaceae bacterium]
MIWQNPHISVEELNTLGAGTIAEVLDIKFIDVGPNYIKASMPVDARTKQPYGLLHGGASCVLAETLGSVASVLVVDQERQICVGLEINANHVRGVRSGLVIATATPLHLGASTHVWDIKIHDEREKLVCVSRLTVAILKKPGS